MGALIAGFAFLYASWIILKTLLYGDPVAGYPSLMVVVLMLGGVQLITIGVLGEYVGRMFNETKQRPLYLLNEYHPPVQSRPGRRVRRHRPEARTSSNSGLLVSIAQRKRPCG